MPEARLKSEDWLLRLHCYDGEHKILTCFIAPYKINIKKGIGAIAGVKIAPIGVVVLATIEVSGIIANIPLYTPAPLKLCP